MTPPHQIEPYTDDYVARHSGDVEVNGKTYRNVTSEQLRQLHQMGKGSYGHVYACDFQGCIVAVKKIRRLDGVSAADLARKRMYMDLKVIRECAGSPFIVNFYGYILDENCLSICMERMATSLGDLVERRGGRGLPEGVLAKAAYSVVKGLEHLKSQRPSIIHRDIKPSNILMDEGGNFKLCDFGMSGILLESKTSSNTRGTMAYLAPERCTVEEAEYTISADVWSLGITMVELATGRHPYAATVRHEGEVVLFHTIQSGNPPQLQPGDGCEGAEFSAGLCDFVNGCLRKGANDRLKVPDLLASPFLAGVSLETPNLGEWAYEQLQEVPN